MIPYARDSKHTVPISAVKIIGLGGAGTNMLELVALDGMEGAELLALNTDVRTLSTSLAQEKIQLGVNLTKGLGSGGDPELGHQAALEAEDQIRDSIKGRRIIFLCVGLGGGTGSGSAAIITRIAREEGAFVVVFATMPFAFEGKRRREQAETALNELAVLSNALVTFDNNRMGELVLAKQGIHQAFGAADLMICESIKAVIRLVVRPGLINIGLDDLVSALRTNRSRCLFGSGIADGEDRAVKALQNALNSPLLDQGTLLKEAQTVLVHLSGGEDLTLFEIEMLMQRLQKFVPDEAHVLFGAAIDPAMGKSISITLISALPEDYLSLPSRDALSGAAHKSPAFQQGPEPSAAAKFVGSQNVVTNTLPPLDSAEKPEESEEDPSSSVCSFTSVSSALSESEFDEDLDEDQEHELENSEAIKSVPSPVDKIESVPVTTSENPFPAPKRRPNLVAPWRKSRPPEPEDNVSDPFESDLSANTSKGSAVEFSSPKLGNQSSAEKLDILADASSRGRFEGENPNVVDGEDLDLPPFLRNKK